MGDDSSDLRCSVRTRARGDLPVATAAAAPTQVLVETPLPWPADVSTLELHGAVAAVAGPGARLHAVVPAPHRPPGEAEVVVHRADAGPFSGYRRRSATGPVGAVPELVAHLLTDRSAEAGEDLLVCGHGARDRCCGSAGTALAGRLAGRRSPAGVMVRRAGHLGGHRFAPTALHLPTGTAWAWLDDELVAAVLDRSRPPAALRGHYRGSAAVAHPAAQVLEAEAFAAVGWAWLDGPRDVVVHGETAAGAAWDVEVTGAGRRWRAEVVKAGEVPQPVCGQAEPGPKRDPTWRVERLVEGPA